MLNITNNKLAFICFFLIVLTSCRSFLSTSLEGKYKWNKNPIYVCWEGNPGDFVTEKNWVKEAITNSWEKVSAVKFTGWCPCNQDDRGIRIKVIDDKIGPHVLALGRKLNNYKSPNLLLNFTFVSWKPEYQIEKEKLIKMISIHEFGHALGFAHEQNNKNCDFKECKEKAQGKSGDWFFPSCDLYSVMNYCNPNYLGDGILSENDIKAVSAIYGLKLTTVGSKADLDLVYNYRSLDEKGFFEKFFDLVRLRSYQSHEFRIFVQGEIDEIRKINHVIYHLPKEDFKNDSMYTYNQEVNFGILLQVFGPIDSLYASIFFDDGTKFTTKAHNLDWPNSSRKIK